MKRLLAGWVCLICLSAAPASAAITFNSNVTPDVIFGTGNPNGGWTVDRQNGVEVGLRAKVRFSPVFNSNGDGTYSHFTGISSGTAALWNYEFAVNTDFAGTTGQTLANIDFLLSVDTDPTAGVNFVTFNIFESLEATAGLGFVDNAVGNNATGNGGGVATNNALVFNPQLVAQNSQNLGFGNPAFFDANQEATWDFQLTAQQGATTLAQTSIQVNVTAVPEPSSLAIWSLLLTAGAMGLIWHRKTARRKSAVA